MCYFYKLIKTQKALYLFNLIPKTYDVKPLKKKKIIVFEHCEIRILRLILHQSSRKYKKMDYTNTTSILMPCKLGTKLFQESVNVWDIEKNRQIIKKQRLQLVTR